MTRVASQKTRRVILTDDTPWDPTLPPERWALYNADGELITEGIKGDPGEPGPAGADGAPGPAGAPGGSATVPMDPWHNVGAVGEPAFQNSWANFGGTAAVLAFRKNPLGKVQLRGVIKGGASNTIIFTLPVGNRPPSDVAYEIPTASASTRTFLTVTALTGNVSIGTVGTTAQATYVDVVEFDTDSVTAMPTGPQGPAGPTGPAGAPGGNATVPMDTFHTVGAVGEPAFQNGAAAVAGYNVRFRKDPLGKVSISGVLFPASGSGDHIVFTLPAGYRPVGNDRNFSSTGNTGPVGVWVNTDGAVHAPKGYTSIYLDNVEFDTESVTAMPTGPQGPAGAGAQAWYVENLPTLDSANTGVWNLHGDIVNGITVVNGDLIGIRFEALWYTDAAGGGQGVAGIWCDEDLVWQWVVNQLSPLSLQLAILGSASGASSTAGRVNHLTTAPSGLISTAGATTSMNSANAKPAMGIGHGDGSGTGYAPGGEFVFRTTPGTHSVSMRFYAQAAPAGNYHLLQRRMWVRVLPKL